MTMHDNAEEDNWTNSPLRLKNPDKARVFPLEYEFRRKTQEHDLEVNLASSPLRLKNPDKARVFPLEYEFKT